MADVAEILLDDVRAKLCESRTDDATKARLLGYINRGMARLSKISGASSVDFTVEGQAKSLLLDYCRYANSDALEVFEVNFERDLMDLALTTSAPAIGSLTVVATVGSSGYTLTAAPALRDGDSYVYAIGGTIPARSDICMAGSGWTAWTGDEISASSGSVLTLVEIDSDSRAVNAGQVTLA